MEITLFDVRKVFQDLLEGTITRETADRWAYGVVQAHEAQNVCFQPREDESRIWAGVMYLYGIDIMDAPDSYLHNEEDIRKVLDETLVVS